jgi:hypothetical protein
MPAQGDMGFRVEVFPICNNIHSSADVAADLCNRFDQQRHHGWNQVAGIATHSIPARFRGGSSKGDSNMHPARGTPSRGATYPHDHGDDARLESDVAPRGLSVDPILDFLGTLRCGNELCLDRLPPEQFELAAAAVSRLETASWAALQISVIRLGENFASVQRRHPGFVKALNRNLDLRELAMPAGDVRVIDLTPLAVVPSRQLTVELHGPYMASFTTWLPAGFTVVANDAVKNPSWVHCLDASGSYRGSNSLHEARPGKDPYLHHLFIAAMLRGSDTEVIECAREFLDPRAPLSSRQRTDALQAVDGSGQFVLDRALGEQRLSAAQSILDLVASPEAAALDDDDRIYFLLGRDGQNRAEPLLFSLAGLRHKAYQPWNGFVSQRVRSIVISASLTLAQKKVLIASESQVKGIRVSAAERAVQKCNSSMPAEMARVILTHAPEDQKLELLMAIGVQPEDVLEAKRVRAGYEERPLEKRPRLARLPALRWNVVVTAEQLGWPQRRRFIPNEKQMLVVSEGDELQEKELMGSEESGEESEDRE